MTARSVWAMVCGHELWGAEPLARALAAAGDEVHLWTPDEPAAPAAGVTVHRVGRHFGPATWRRMSRELALLAPNCPVLLHYVPHSFGAKGMNLPFADWAARQRSLWVWFHEVAYPRLPGQPWRHDLLVAVTERMAAHLQRACRRSFISTPAWEPRLHELAPGSVACTWLPVYSNLPTRVEAGEREAARTRLGAMPQTQLLAHFGTYYEYPCQVLRETVPMLLRNHPERRMALLGRGGERLRGELLAANAALDAQVVAPGWMAAEQAAAGIAAADVLIEPYPDGMSSRRGSALAALALGRPVVSNHGAHTEPLWTDAGALELVSASAAELPAALAERCERLLGEPQRRRQMGERARALYREIFDLDRAVATLRGVAQQPESALLSRAQHAAN